MRNASKKHKRGIHRNLFGAIKCDTLIQDLEFLSILKSVWHQQILVSEPSAYKMSLASLQIPSPLDFMEQFIRLQS